MSTPFPDSHFSPTGVYYPRGHVFAMFRDAAAAQAAAQALGALAGVGGVQVVGSQAIVEQFGARAAEVGGAPSVGREDQFMRRFVELAGQGLHGVLVDVGDADTDAIAQALQRGGAVLGYHYRALVIEELIDTSPRAEAAAAGKL